LNKKYPLDGSISSCYNTILLEIPDTLISNVLYLNVILPQKNFSYKINDLSLLSAQENSHTYSIPTEVRTEGTFFHKLSMAYPFNLLLQSLISSQHYFINTSIKLYNVSLLLSPYIIGVLFVLFSISCVFLLFTSLRQIIRNRTLKDQVAFGFNSKSFFNFYLPVIIFLTAFLWKLFYINFPYVWFDESGMIFNALHNIKYILALPSEGEPNPPLFMLLMHFWIKVFGIEAYSIRIIPNISNAITAVILYFIGKKFYNPRTGILISGFFILSYSHFFFGLCARPYSMISMCTSISLYCFLVIMRKPENKKAFFCLILSNFLLLYIHYFGLFVIFIQLVLSFLYSNNRSFIKKLRLSVFVIGILYLPMLPIIIKQFSSHVSDNWRQNYLMNPNLSEYFSQLFGYFNERYIFLIIVFFVIIGTLKIVFIDKMKKMISKDLIFLFLWWFIPYTLMFLLSRKIPMWLNTYLLFNSIGLYVFFGVFINKLFTQKMFWAICIVLFFLIFINLDIKSLHPNNKIVQNSVNAIKSTVSKDNSILISKWSDFAFIYYYDKEIFKNIYQYDSLLNSNNIYAFRNRNEAKKRLKNITSGRLIYVYTWGWEDDNTRNFIDSSYTRTGSITYPECLQVILFEKKGNLEPKF